MKRFIAILLVSLIASPAAAQCPVEWPFASIDVSPDEPEVGETVTVTVRGEHSDLCWSVLSHDCGSVVGQEITITVDSYDCANRECYTCPLATSPFEISCEYVFNVPGTYVIRADETADTMRFYCGSDQERTIEVSGSVPNEASSWAAIKALFR